MTIKHVKNWYSLVVLYLNLVPRATVQFRDGEKITIYRKEKNSKTKLQSGFAFPEGTLTWMQNSINFDKFYEILYKKYLISKGFEYTDQGIVNINPMNLKVKIFEPYSFVLDEVFVMKVYGDSNLIGRTVIDIGASIGDSSLYFSTLGAKEIYAFELDPQRYELALQNIKLNNLEDKITIFNQSANSQTITELLEGKKLSNVFLKLDCEGCEYQILQDIDKATLHRVRDIVMEFHGDPKIILEKLKEGGFNLKRKGTIIFGNRVDSS